MPFTRFRVLPNNPNVTGGVRFQPPGPTPPMPVPVPDGKLDLPPPELEDLMDFRVLRDMGPSYECIFPLPVTQATLDITDEGSPRLEGKDANDDPVTGHATPIP